MLKNQNVQVNDSSLRKQKKNLKLTLPKVYKFFFFFLVEVFWIIILIVTLLYYLLACVFVFTSHLNYFGTELKKSKVLSEKICKISG